MYIRGVSGGAEQADGENEPEILLEQHDIKNMTLTASKRGWETRFVLLRGENVVRGKHKNVLFLNGRLYCLIKPGA